MAFITTPLQVARSRLDYTSCTVEELQRFIKDRVGAPPVNDDDVQSCSKALEGLSVEQRDKKACIKVLKDLDASLKFHFCGLPKELRLGVYEELLDYSHEDDHTWKSTSPQILATNKQIHDEAIPIARQSLRFTTLIHINAPRYTADFSHVPTLRLGLLPPIQIEHIIAAKHVAQLYPRCDVQAPRVVMVIASYRKAFEHLRSLPALIERTGCSSILLKIYQGTFENPTNSKCCEFSDEEVVTSLQLPTSAGSTTITIQGQECKHLDWLRAEMTTSNFAALVKIELDMARMLDLLQRAKLSKVLALLRFHTFRIALPTYFKDFEPGQDTTSQYPPMLDNTEVTKVVLGAQALLASNEWQQLENEAEAVLGTNRPATE
jgi:hypothetical protein